jgi:hypothetical protein|tara:strand:- start:202 stop:405 length:204 start_codon:yes stop_codon:yes gene_type:complete
MAKLILLHRGRMMDSPVDNQLAEFTSARDAVQCTVAIQNTLKKKKLLLPPPKKTPQDEVSRRDQRSS